MAEQLPPSFLQTSASGTTAEDLRRVFTGITQGTGGVLSPSDLQVTQNDTPNMSVNVATGQAWIPGTRSTYQGSYFVENRGTENLTVAASDPTNDRIDLVVAEIRDSQYSGASNDWQLRIITGTPAASPTTPATPADAIDLASISVLAGSTTVTSASISDLRSFASIRGAIWRNTSATRPSAPEEGQTIYEKDTDQVFVYNGSIWCPVGVSYLANMTDGASASTGYVTVPGCSITLPPGKWALTGKGQWSVSTGTTREYFVQIFNSTDSVQIAEAVIGAAPTNDVKPMALALGELENSATNTVVLRARVSAVDGVQASYAFTIRADSMIKLP